MELAQQVTIRDAAQLVIKAGRRIGRARRISDRVAATDESPAIDHRQARIEAAHDLPVAEQDQGHGQWKVPTRGVYEHQPSRHAAIR